jgi:hypothetical protein
MSLYTPRGVSQSGGINERQTITTAPRVNIRALPIRGAVLLVITLALGLWPSVVRGDAWQNGLVITFNQSD